MKSTVDNKDIIDRKTASKLMKISVRTIDRYRESGKLTTQIINNKIFLSRSEILEYLQKQSEKIWRHGRQEKNQKESMDKLDDTRTKGEDMQNGQYGRYEGVEPHSEPVFVDTRTAQSHRAHDHAQDDHSQIIATYQRMYEEVAAELKRKQMEIEAAHYRIGQLEGQLRFAMPLPEHRSEVRKLTDAKTSLQQEADEAMKKLKKIRNAWYFERLNKRIYAGIVIGILLLESLWYYLAT